MSIIADILSQEAKVNCFGNYRLFKQVINKGRFNSFSVPKKAIAFVTRVSVFVELQDDIPDAETDYTGVFDNLEINIGGKIIRNFDYQFQTYLGDLSLWQLSIDCAVRVTGTTKIEIILNKETDSINYSAPRAYAHVVGINPN